MLKIKVDISKAMDSINQLYDAIDMLIMKADEDLKEELEDEGYVAVDEAVTTVNELEDGWTQAYNDQCDDLLKRLQDAVGVDDFVEKTWPKMKNETDLRDAIYSVFRDRFFALLEASVTGWLAGDDPDLLEDGMEILSKPAKDFVENWSSQLSGLMQLSTNEQIEKILVNGQKEHLSVMQVAQNIADSGIRDPGYKARRAALTEVMRAESYGQLEAMKQNPAIIEKEWQHTGRHKNKPRENHVAISGQRKPVNEPFDLAGADGGSYKPMCPRDTCLPAGESINCHCLMKSIRDPNWKNLSVEERRALREQRMKELDEKDYTDGGILQTGGKISYDFAELDEARTEKATEMYEAFKKTDDISMIAECSGMTEDEIRQIKNHIFYDDHILYEGKGKFIPDLDMAVAWKRLQEGNPEERDLLLLKHELLESQVETAYNLTASEAHARATEKYDWAALIEELFGEEGEGNDLLQSDE